MPFEIEYFFRLIWLFVIVITFLMLFLCYLYFAKRRAQQQEHKSLTFSHLVIEGMEMERRRISREFHDIVLPQVRDLPVSDQIRSMCLELMPPDFSRISLKDSFAEACDKFSKRTGIECACFLDDKLSFTSVSAENQLHLFRIVQESLANIEKHSKAKKASLVARCSGETKNILICVSDDGVGLINQIEGLGMKSMQQRAGIIGARLDFISESGNGLMVRIEVEIRE